MQYIITLFRYITYLLSANQTFSRK